jgi:hypothetical protein
MRKGFIQAFNPAIQSGLSHLNLPGSYAGVAPLNSCAPLGFLHASSHQAALSFPEGWFAEMRLL